ncbi:hypothetical protein DL93DRAFT_500602 [Clavulina sp. PMI_390]|nr:hypothetical protein DL93DRAFT_500602 [Clavulina sp. PMI_390]
MVTSFLGHQTINHRPVDIVDAMWKHPYSRDSGPITETPIPFSASYPPPHARPLSSEPSPNEVNIPIIPPLDAELFPGNPHPTSPHSPPNLSNDTRASDSKERAHIALSRYFVTRVSSFISGEMKRLASQPEVRAHHGQEFSWKSLLSFSFSQLQTKVIEVAPTLWTVLATAAVDTSKRPETASSVSADGRTHTPRDPWISCTVSALMLLYHRNIRCNIMQSIIGTTLFSTNAHRTVHAILSRLGLSVAYSTTTSSLHNLGFSASQKLLSIGRLMMNGVLSAHVVYDNINQYRRDWHSSLGSKNHLESGTAATCIIQENVPGGAFQGPPCYTRPPVPPQEDITFDTLCNEINEVHLEETGVVVILRSLFDRLPYLARRHPDLLGQFLDHRIAKHKLALRKTAYYPMECSNADESTTAGNLEVMNDIARQLGIQDEEFDLKRPIITVSGDQMSVARLRSVKYATQFNRSWSQAKRWVFPLIELWHMRYAYLHGIFSSHWSSATMSGDTGLRSWAEKLNRHINPLKLDFYPADRLATTLKDALTLNFVRIYIRHKCPILSRRTPSPTSLHLHEELLESCEAGGFLHKASSEELIAMAHSIYCTFGTSQAAINALHELPAAASEFFHEFSAPLPSYPRPSTSSFHVPSSEPGTADVEAGVSFLSSPTGCDLPSDEMMYTANHLAGLHPVADDDDDNVEEKSDAHSHPNSNASSGAGSSGSKHLRVPLVKPLPPPKMLQGDLQLYNTIILYRDLIRYSEFRESVHDGDIGRTFEVIKWLRFYFFGSSQYNYGNELLRQFADFRYRCTPDMLTAIMENYLVNPSGLCGRWHERDLLQEHLNFWLKRVFNGQLLTFDSSFYREAVSLNIVGFKDLSQSIFKTLGLSPVHSGHTLRDVTADINHLGLSFLDENLHIYTPGRAQTFACKDSVTRGGEKLLDGKLESFLNQYDAEDFIDS